MSGASDYMAGGTTEAAQAATPTAAVGLRVVDANGLTEAQYGALRVLSIMFPKHLATVADDCGVSTQAATRTLRALVRRHLASCAITETGVVFYATPAGRRAYKAFQAPQTGGEHDGD